MRAVLFGCGLFGWLLLAGCSREHVASGPRDFSSPVDFGQRGTGSSSAPGDGTGKLYAACTTSCDCLPGFACLQQICTLSQADAHYCCEAFTCPVGSLCQSAAGEVARCVAPPVSSASGDGGLGDAGGTGGTNDGGTATSDGGSTTTDGGTGITGSMSGLALGASAVYAHSSQGLYRVDPDTWHISFVEAFGWPEGHDSMTDIAIDKRGAMIGISYSRLYSVSAIDAKCTLIAPLALGFNGLSYLQDGAIPLAVGEVLVATSTNGGYYAIDPRTGVATQLGTYGHGYGSSGDLVSVTGFGTVATIRTSYGGVDSLARIEPMTGAATIIGSTGVRSIWGLGYWRGKVFGFTGAGDFVVIDPATATATIVETGSVAWAGAAVTTSAPTLP